MSTVARTLTVLLLSVLWTSSTLAQTRPFRIDVAHSQVGFVIAIAGGLQEVEGRFTRFSGTVHYDPDDPAASRVEVTIDPASIDTGNDRRDNHLRTEDFFHVEAHPQIMFTSEEILPAEDGGTLVGTLTMRGVSRRVEISFRRTHEDPVMILEGAPTAVFVGTVRLDREDFGIKATPRWNRILAATGELAMADEVDVELRLMTRVDSPSG